MHAPGFACPVRASRSRVAGIDTQPRSSGVVVPADTPDSATSRPPAMGARTRRSMRAWWAAAPFVFAAIVSARAAGADGLGGCATQLNAVRVSKPLVREIPGGGFAELDVAAPAGHRVLIEAAEHGVDTVLEVTSGGGPPVARAETPIRRAGTLRVVTRPPADGSIHLRVASKEHPHASGRVEVGVFDLERLPASSPCREARELLAAGDEDLSVGLDVYLGRLDHGGLRARHPFLRAVEEYMAAYQLTARERDPDDGAAIALAVASTYYFSLKDWHRSREWAVRARDEAISASSRYVRARAESLVAVSWIEAPGTPGESSTAKQSGSVLERVRTDLRRLEAFHRERHEPYDSALQRQAIAYSYFREGNYRACVTENERAARMFRAIHEAPKEGSVTVGAGQCVWGLGDTVAAEKLYRRGSELMRPEPYWALGGMTALGLLAQANGRLDDALRQSTEALRLAEKLQAKILVGNNLYALGAEYYAVGDLEQSISYLEKSIANRSPDEHSQEVTLRTLAAVYRDAGRVSDARATEEKALSVAYSPVVRARIEIAMARDDAALGSASKGVERLDRVLAGAARGAPSVYVEAMLARATVNRTRHRLDEALADLSSARKQLGSMEDPESEFALNVELARAQMLKGNLSEAGAAAERAVALAQLLRRQSANPDLRALRQESLRQAHEVKIEVLMRKRTSLLRDGGRRAARECEREALATADASRAQALLDYSALASSDAIAPGFGAELRRREELYRELGLKLGQLDVRVDELGDDSEKVRKSRGDILEIRRELDSLNARLATTARRSGGMAAPDPAAWSRWLAQHGPDAAIVEYWLGEDEAYAWVIDASGIAQFELGDSSSIDAAARALHESLRAVATTARSDRPDLAATLGERLLRPLESVLARRRTIIVVPDQALSYVSFAGLIAQRSPERRYLVQTHDVAMTPAVWWLFRPVPPERRLPGAGILIVSDPVYDENDGRLSARPSRLTADDRPVDKATVASSRIPSTGREGDAIEKAFPAGEVRRLDGLSATRARFLAEPLQRFRYVHVAAHGYVDSRMPQMASIVLGSFDDRGPVADVAVRAADVMERDLRADVVTLSACDTALGKTVSGEGAAGLGYAVLARGARSVLASLWAVSDEITADVMTDFYRSITERRLSPAGALGDAMRAVLRSRPGLDPAYWAAYQLTISDLGASTIVSRIP